ncbi:MAG: hypothetical protein M1836_003279 [Candelina mexicana]|nr:MAG: hypothetical protein M1836_003279 [Candelina mexicana]
MALQSASLFFHLPPELRVLIYQEVLPSDELYHQCAPELTQADTSSGDSLLIPLFLACKDLSTEALPIFYSRNRFCLSSNLDGSDLLRGVPSIPYRTPSAFTRIQLLQPHLRRCIRALKITVPSDGCFDEWKCFINFILRELSVKDIVLSFLILESHSLGRAYDLPDALDRIQNKVTVLRIHCQGCSFETSFWGWMADTGHQLDWPSMCHQLAKKLPNVRDFVVLAEEKDLSTDFVFQYRRERAEVEEETLKPFVLGRESEELERCIFWSRPESFGVFREPLSKNDYHAWLQGDLDVSEGKGPHCEDTIRNEIILNPPLLDQYTDIFPQATEEGGSREENSSSDEASSMSSVGPEE